MFFIKSYTAASYLELLSSCKIKEFKYNGIVESGMARSAIVYTNHQVTYVRPYHLHHIVDSTSNQILILL